MAWISHSQVTVAAKKCGFAKENCLSATMENDNMQS